MIFLSFRTFSLVQSLMHTISAIDANHCEPTVGSIDAMIHHAIHWRILHHQSTKRNTLWNHLSSMVKSNSAKSPSATSASTDLSGGPTQTWGSTNPSATIQHQAHRGLAWNGRCEGLATFFKRNSKT